jgi:hypothetical protein
MRRRGTVSLVSTAVQSPEVQNAEGKHRPHAHTPTRPHAHTHTPTGQAAPFESGGEREASTPRLMSRIVFYTFCGVPHASQAPAGDSWAISLRTHLPFLLSAKNSTNPFLLADHQRFSGPSFRASGICRQYYEPFSDLARRGTAAVEMLFLV